MGGKVVWKSLDTTVFSVARQRLPDTVREHRSRVESHRAFASGKMTVGDAARVYSEKVDANVSLKPRTKAYYHKVKLGDVIFGQSVIYLEPGVYKDGSHHARIDNIPKVPECTRAFQTQSSRTTGVPRGWLVIRGISDAANRKKNDGARKLAAFNAARVMMTFLSGLTAADFTRKPKDFGGFGSCPSPHMMRDS